MSTPFRLLSGTGNRFAVVDAIRDGAPGDAAAMARALCAPGAYTPPLDGLLLVVPARAGGVARMELVNADGSRPETCGNGLRCVAKLLVEHGHVRGDAFTIEDDAGLHDARTTRDQERVTHAAVSMGRPRVLERDEALTFEAEGVARTVRGTRVDVGNPHFVFVVEDERTAGVTTIGPRVERHAAFPAGTNVEFVAQRDGATYLRVWERGVGETAACGSGACATAAALVALGRARLPLVLRLPGGELAIATTEAGAYVLSGAIEDFGAGTWSGAGAAARRR